jgi:type IV fimbrial biogenesis protein FimT
MAISRNKPPIGCRKIMHNQPEYNMGFTLLELMITVGIAAILMSMAIPSFNSTIRSTRLTTYANELVTSLNLARSEAVKRGLQVTVTRKGATSSQWESGWDVFVDSDSSNAFNDNGNAILCEAGEDCLLRTYGALSGGYTLTTGNSTYQDYAAYLPSGLSTSSFGDTFRLCSGTDTATSRAIAMNSIGRAQVSTPAASCP